MYPECEQFSGRKRQICRCEVLTVVKCQHYRSEWGLLPADHVQLAFTVQQKTQAVSFLQTASKQDEKASKATRIRNFIGHGPGTEYRKLANTFRIVPKKICSCAVLCDEMDALGVDGCRRERANLVARLRLNYETLGIIDKAVAAVTGGFPAWLNPFDPVTSMLDEAIRLADTTQSRQVIE